MRFDFAQEGRDGSSRRLNGCARFVVGVGRRTFAGVPVQRDVLRFTGIHFALFRLEVGRRRIDARRFLDRNRIMDGKPIGQVGTLKVALALAAGVVGFVAIDSLIQIFRFQRNQERMRLSGFFSNDVSSFQQSWQKWRNRFNSKRTPGVLSNFADFLDLMALSLSCGFTIDDAWTVSVEGVPVGRVKRELTISHDQLKLGRPASVVMRHLAERLSDPRLAMVLALIRQSLSRGVPLQATLLEQSHWLRELRFAELERRAQTTGLRLLFPIMVFLLPAFLLLLLFPFAMQLSESARMF